MVTTVMAIEKTLNTVTTTGAVSVGVIYLFGISLPMWAAIFSISWITYIAVKEVVTVILPNAWRLWKKFRE